MSYDAKYDGLIDAQTWAFIRETESFYPPDAIGLSTEGQRAFYDRMCKAFHAGRPPGVTGSRHSTWRYPLRANTKANPTPKRRCYTCMAAVSWWVG